MFLLDNIANFFHPQESAEQRDKNMPPISAEEASIRKGIPQTTEESIKVWMDCVRNGQIGWGNPIEDLERDAPDYMTAIPYNSPSSTVLVRTEQPKRRLLSNQLIQLAENNLNHYSFLQKMNPQDYQEICMHHMLNQLSAEVVNNYINAPEKNPDIPELQEALRQADIRKSGDMLSLAYEKLAGIKQLLAGKLPEICPDFNRQCQNLPSYPQSGTIPPLTSFQKYQIVHGCEDGLIYDATSEDIRRDIIQEQLFINQTKEKINHPQQNSNILPQIMIYGDKDKIKRPPLNQVRQSPAISLEKLPVPPSANTEKISSSANTAEQQYLNKVSDIMQRNHQKIAELRAGKTQRSTEANQAETAKSKTNRLHELRFATTHKENRNTSPTVIDAQTMNRLITLRAKLNQ